MSLILAIEPDALQAEVLSRVVRERTGSGVDLVMAKSADAAFAALEGRMPDVLLLGRDLTKAEQDAVVARLAMHGDPSTLFRLAIPELRVADGDEPRRSSWRLPFGRNRQSAGDGWDPVLFVDQITSHIEQRERELARAGLRVASVSKAIADRFAAASDEGDDRAVSGHADVDEVDRTEHESAEAEAIVASEAIEPDDEQPSALESDPAIEPDRSSDAGAQEMWAADGAGDDGQAGVWQAEDEPVEPQAEPPASSAGAPFSGRPADDTAYGDWTLPAIDAVVSHDEWTASPRSGAPLQEIEAPHEHGEIDLTARDADAPRDDAVAWSEAQAGDPPSEWHAPASEADVRPDAGFVAAHDSHASGETFEWNGARVVDPQEPWQPPQDGATWHEADSTVAEESQAPVDDAFAWGPSGDMDRSDPATLMPENVEEDDPWNRQVPGEIDADAFGEIELTPFETVEAVEDDRPRAAPDESADLSETDDEVSIDLSEDEDVFEPRPVSFHSAAPSSLAGARTANAISSRDADDAEDEASGLERASGRWRDEGVIDAEVHAAELALAEVRAEERLASEVQRVRAEAAAQHAEELARLEAEAAAAREAAVIEARAAAEADARAALAAELARLRSEAEQKLASELSRVREEAAQNLTEQIGRTRAEADHVLERELARAQAEAETVRAAAYEEARRAAETTAARATAAEVDRVREETEARLEAELARVRAEAERERRTHEQRERDAESLRERAAREAREAAEAEAARMLEAEVERVKAEADARLAEELARMQRAASAQEHRSAPDAEAARALDAEMAQARAEAAAQLQAELEQLRAEAAEARRLRAEADRQAEQARGAAAREAREAAERAVQRTVADESARVREEAEARLAAETARVRAEAEERLAAELAAFSAEAERRRQNEIREMRSQMARMRDALYESQMTGEMVVPGGGYVGHAPMVRRPPRRNWLLESSWPRHAAVIAVIVAVTSFVIDVPSLLQATVGRARGVFEAVVPPSATPTAPVVAEPAPDPAPAPAPVVPAPRAREPRTANPPRTSTSRGTTAVSGTLTVSSRIPLDVYVDNRRIGTSEGPILLAPGWHALRLVSNTYNYRDEVAVEIRPGDAVTHTVTLPMGQVRVRSTAGAEVWVEGALVGHAPMVEVEVPIGTREVVVRHPELGSRRAAVEVRYGLWADVILPLERQAEAPPTPPQLPPLSRRPAPRPTR